MEQARDRLLKIAKSPSISHAYLLEGRNCEAKDVLAMEFALAITPHREDIFVVETEGLSVKDKDIDELQDRLMMKPFVGDRIVAVIRDADRMTHRAQNRFLKTLEEPKGASVVILQSENAEYLLPTLVSRCVLVRTGNTCEQSKGDQTVLSAAARAGELLLSKGTFYESVKAISDVETDRDSARQFLETLEEWLRDRAMESVGWNDGTKSEYSGAMKEALSTTRVMTAIAAIEEAKKDIERFVKPGYALKSMLLKILQEEA
jgi:DNA polymerase-3 subunit delta'